MFQYFGICNIAQRVTIGNTIGKVNLIQAQFNNSFISNNTSRYRLKTSEKNYYFELLLRSFIVQEQIQRQFTQTAQPKISNEALEKIYIPILEDNTKQKIEDFIIRYYKLREDSEKLLILAKQAVEMAIEEGELTAIKWIEKNMKDIIKK